VTPDLIKDYEQTPNYREIEQVLVLARLEAQAAKDSASCSSPTDSTPLSASAAECTGGVCRNRGVIRLPARLVPLLAC
jgi:hypothetical protein